MLVIDEQTQKYLDDVKEFAKKVGKLEQLEERLKYLNDYANLYDSEKGLRVVPEVTRCLLHKDFAPYSFEFTMLRQLKHPAHEGNYDYWFNGGLIFHGTHDNGGDGGAPTFSVNLSPEDGWSIHT